MSKFSRHVVTQTTLVDDQGDEIARVLRREGGLVKVTLGKEPVLEVPAASIDAARSLLVASPEGARTLLALGGVKSDALEVLVELLDAHPTVLDPEPAADTPTLIISPPAA
jgi:hypothetical protein